MANLTIPDRYRAGLTALLSMSDEAAQELLDALTVEHPALPDTDLLAYLKDNLKLTRSDDLANVVPALLWLCAGRSITDMPNNELARDVSQSKDLEATDEQRRELEQRLVRFLRTKSLTVTWKALDIVTEHQNTFYDARILTDVRPIFGEDLEVALERVMNIHNHVD